MDLDKTLEEVLNEFKSQSSSDMMSDVIDTMISQPKVEGTMLPTDNKIDLPVVDQKKVSPDEAKNTCIEFIKAMFSSLPKSQKEFKPQLTILHVVKFSN